MATHVSREGCDGATLPGVVPFEVDCPSRLSWELGSRVVGDDDVTLRGEWEHTGSSWTLALYRVTTHTDVVRLRTPVGRERFYGAARMDLDAAVPSLADAPTWRRRA
jgi:hypothetical protein